MIALNWLIAPRAPPLLAPNHLADLWSAPVSKLHVRSSLSTHTPAEGALLLALAEAAAGVPVAGGFFRDSVGGFAANAVEPDPILA